MYSIGHRTMTQLIKSKSYACKQNSYMHIYLIHLDFIIYVVYFDTLLEFLLFSMIATMPYDSDPAI